MKRSKARLGVNRWLTNGMAAALGCLWLAAAAPPSSSEQAVQRLVDGARESHSDAMRVVRDGKVLADYHKPGPVPGRIEMMSATKSLVGLAVGRLLAQGKLRSIEQPVSDFYPEWKQGQKAKITVRMLLNHTSGLQNVPSTLAEIYPAPDCLQLALAAELSEPPGKRFRYNNKAMNLLAGVIEKASGRRMDEYIAKELLEPMGIQGMSWSADGYDKAGHPYAMAGWRSTAADAVKIGQLVLDHGVWNGKPLVTPEYIREMVGQSQPLTAAYGLLWWRRREQNRFHFDAESVKQLLAAGIDKALVDKFAVLRDRPFSSAEQFRQAARAAMGEDLKALGGALAARSLSFDEIVREGGSPIVAYEAQGYLGQFIVVVPKARLVAVRQIDGSQDDPDRPWPNGYDDFTSRVIALARTLEPSLTIDNP